LHGDLVGDIPPVEEAYRNEYPKNCHLYDDDSSPGFGKLWCDYVGDDYDEYVKELDNSFTSDQGCTLT
jgi:hypothetical protein